MHITKFGHSCLLIEEGGVRILLDPGSYSTLQNEARDVAVILITHEHQDHLDMESLKVILKNNANAKVIANSGAAKILAREGIVYEVMGNGDSDIIEGVLIEGFGAEHAVIHASIPIVANTGFFIAGRFFYPGDAFIYPSVSEPPMMDLVKDAPATYGRTIAHMPLSSGSPFAQDNPFLHAKVGLPKPIEILALPVSAPWMRASEAIDYAAHLKPKVCIPVHDGMLKNPESAHRLPRQILEPMGIEVRVLEIGNRVEFY